MQGDHNLNRALYLKKYWRAGDVEYGILGHRNGRHHSHSATVRALAWLL